MTHNGQQIARYGALTFLVTGGVLLGDFIGGRKVSVTHAAGLLLFTAALCVAGGALKVIWNRWSPSAKGKFHKP